MSTPWVDYTEVPFFVFSENTTSGDPLDLKVVGVNE